MYRFNASPWPSTWSAEEGHSFATAAYLAWHNHSYGPCYGPLKLTLSSNINLIGAISLLVCYWPPPATMNAVSATIVAGRRAQIRLNIEVNINNLISTLNY
jgi:hypothetical protein